ncbi:MAG TPA: hypothetical protein PKB02_07905 [Anaerohalosphaeraceae bacterium]|nr:hypothetical protein [Anaerohalosphaeraceae bacterium]
MTGSKPIKRISAGQITAALWENEVNINGQPTTVLKVSVQKAYKDRTGTWKTSNSFSRNDIPLVQFTLQKAFETMLGERTISTTENAPAEEEVVA